MNSREHFINDYIKRNGLPNSKIIDYLEKDKFDIYTKNVIPIGLSLADSVYYDENGALQYAFAKGEQGEEMRLITGYTGSGKSTRYLLQNLFVAIEKGQSVIVTDMVGELIAASYDYLRSKNVKVRLINFADVTKTDTYNPFLKEAIKTKSLKRIPSTAVKLIASITDGIITTKSSKDPSWEQGAKNILSGIIYGFFEAVLDGVISPEDVTLYNVIQSFYWLKNNTSYNGFVTLKNLEYYKDKDPNSRSVQSIMAQVDTGGITRSGYFAIANDNINLINNEFTYNVTSTNNINIEDLWNEQTALFIITDGHSIGDVVTRLLVSDLETSAKEHVHDKLDKRLPRPIQLFLDEFANIPFGDTQTFKKMLTTMRKHNVFFNMFLQSDAQLIERYGVEGANAIFANVTEIFLGSKDYSTRCRFAKSFGRKTYETLESKLRQDIPILASDDILTPEKLFEMEKGEAYIIRSSGKLLHSYFEASYKCPQFTKSDKYLNDYSNSIFDYEDKIVVQPLMIKQTPVSQVKNMNAHDLHKLVGDNYDDYLDYIQTKILNDKILEKKFVKKGLAFYSNGLLVPTFSAKQFKSILNVNHLNSRQRFTFEEDF